MRMPVSKERKGKRTKERKKNTKKGSKKKKKKQGERCQERKEGKKMKEITIRKGNYRIYSSRYNVNRKKRTISQRNKILNE